jgi:hypothetical protein
MSIPPLPLETARRVARAAIESLDVTLRVDLEATTPTFSYVVVTLVPQLSLGHSGAVRRRNMRESLRVLTALSCCRGLAVAENSAFWSDVWPDDPADQQQPQWVAKWKYLCLRGRPRPAGDEIKFLLSVEDAGIGGRSRHDAVATLEELVAEKDAVESESAGFRITMEVLARHIEPDRWPIQVVCAVEAPQTDGSRWSRLFSDVNDRSRKQVTKMGIPFQLTGCFLSAQHCPGRLNVLKELTTVFQLEAGVVPVKELKLHFRWDPSEKSMGKRLREFKALMWSMANVRDEAAQLRVLQLKGRCLADTSFFGALCSALPSMESLEELRVVLPPVIRKATRNPLWSWLAVSVFHPQSKASVRHLDLSQCNVYTEDVDIVQEVLNHEWSSVMMQLLAGNSAFQDSPPENCDIGMAFVKSGTRVEVEPTRRLFSKPLFTLKHAQELLVLYSSKDWVSVYLPGFGCGFIKRQSIFSISKRSSVRSSGKATLSSMKLKTVDVSATLALLRVGGGQLKRLHLECEAFANEHLKPLTDCCPKLTHLTLRAGKLNDFSTVVDDSVAGVCKVSSLYLLTRKITTSCLEHLAKNLSDPNLASQSRFRELRLQTGLLRKPDMEILLGMLKANQTLRCLHIKIAFNLFDEYMPRYLEHRGDWLRGGDEDRKRLAFLSVIGSRAPAESAMQRIDSTTLATIFEFACAGERLISLDEYTDRMTIQEIVARANAV